ncbi:transglycosylase SLT domain-containing protein [candidate division KSB1 bacterium]|nr:transglycosylase SLT domain-containing protein [candidate division KSB1 bacterium]
MNGIDPAYMLATIRQESNFDTMALRLEPDFFQRRVKENPTYEYEIINHSWNETNFGSYGLGQLLLSTAFDLGWRGVPMELYDPDTNIKYMGLLIKRNMSKLGIKTTPYNEKEIENLAAMYNSGQPLAKAPMITVSDYVPRIKKFYSQFAQEIQSGQA